MAQDFAAAFGLGSDDTHVAPLDVSAAALAAVQALHRQVQAKDVQLGKRVAALEAAVAAARNRRESVGAIAIPLGSALLARSCGVLLPALVRSVGVSGPR